MLTLWATLVPKDDALKTMVADEICISANRIGRKLYAVRIESIHRDADYTPPPHVQNAQCYTDDVKIQPRYMATYKQQAATLRNFRKAVEYWTSRDYKILDASQF